MMTLRISAHASRSGRRILLLPSGVTIGVPLLAAPAPALAARVAVHGTVVTVAMTVRGIVIGTVIGTVNETATATVSETATVIVTVIVTARIETRTRTARLRKTRKGGGVRRRIESGAVRSATARGLRRLPARTRTRKRMKTETVLKVLPTSVETKRTFY